MPKRKLTHGSLFSGVGGFDLGFDQAGIRTLWQCEVDAKCRSVLARHWPDAVRYEDIKDVNGAEITPVDIISFGSPCQDLSCAGNQDGLVKGERSSLFFEAIRIINEMLEATNGKYPQIAIWENVRGALSSNKGKDFETAIQSLVNLGALDVAWRVVNTCHFGPPQRRVRVFVIADFRRERASQVLDQSTRVLWHPPQIGEAWTETTGEVEEGTGSSGWAAGFSAGNSAKAGSIGYQDEMSPTIRAGASGTNQTPTIITTTGIGGWTAASSTTLAITRNVGTGVDDNFARSGHLVYMRVQTANDQTLFEPQSMLAENWAEKTVKLNLRAEASKSSHVIVEKASPPTYRVRRLTPRECERLQGWPDDHTRWTDTGDELKDGTRYRMIGNGVSAPVAQWLGESIVKTWRR